MRIKETKNKFVYTKYSVEECECLKILYSCESKQNILQNFPNRTWDALRRQAKKMGLSKRTMDGRKIKKTTLLKKLLDGSPISFYWLGFILADGSFKKDKAVRCELSVKDRDHLHKLAEYVNALVKINPLRQSTSFEIYDCDIVPKIISLLGIYNTNKTYNCPDIAKLKELSDDSLLSMFAGFIDGDGCIKSNKQRWVTTYLIISNHVSWQPFYQLMVENFNRFSDKPLCNPIITRCRYVRWCCGRKRFLSKLKHQILSLGLPVMSRKWDEIK